MITLNRVAVIGNVGEPPVLRFAPSGKPVANFSVASNHRYTTAEGEKKEETDWFSVVVWGKLAEQCNQVVKKGHLVYVAGRVVLHKWAGQDNIERSRLEIQANSVIFLTKADNHQGDNAHQEAEAEELEPEDIPF